MTHDAGPAGRDAAGGASGSGHRGEGGSNIGAGRGGEVADSGGALETAGEAGKRGHGGESGSDGEGGSGQAGVNGMAGAGGKVPAGVCPDERERAPGLLGCADSFVHRPAASGCALPERDPDDYPPSNESTDDVEPVCARDADCSAGRYCTREETDSGDLYHRCTAACETDADCESGRICVCESYSHVGSGGSITLGTCREATCTQDSDCGSSSFCRSPVNRYSCFDDFSLAFRCQTPEDECSGPDECPDGEGDERAACSPDATGEHLVCALHIDDC